MVCFHIWKDALNKDYSTNTIPNTTGGNVLLLEKFRYHLGNFLMPVMPTSSNYSKTRLAWWIFYTLKRVLAEEGRLRSLLIWRTYCYNRLLPEKWLNASAVNNVCPLTYNLKTTSTFQCWQQHMLPYCRYPAQLVTIAWLLYWQGSIALLLILSIGSITSVSGNILIALIAVIEKSDLFTKR